MEIKLLARYIQLGLIGLLLVFSSISIANSDCMNKLNKSFLEYTEPSSYVSFLLYDQESNDKKRIIIENSHLAAFLSATGKLGEANKPINRGIVSFDSDFVTRYLNYIKGNGGEDLTLDLGKFKNFIASNHFEGRIDQATDFIKSKYIEKDRPFSKFDVKNEHEFIAKYISFDNKTATGIVLDLSYTDDPMFIAKLIDLGYIVIQSDIQPTVITRPMLTLKKTVND